MCEDKIERTDEELLEMYCEFTEECSRRLHGRTMKEPRYDTPEDRKVYFWRYRPPNPFAYPYPDGDDNDEFHRIVTKQKESMDEG